MGKKDEWNKKYIVLATKWERQMGDGELVSFVLLKTTKFGNLLMHEMFNTN